MSKVYNVMNMKLLFSQSKLSLVKISSLNKRQVWEKGKHLARMI